jgi:transposase
MGYYFSRVKGALNEEVVRQAINLIQCELSDDDVLGEYKAQQSTERGFRFLKDPLFFTSSVFLNSTQRVAALAIIIYSHS